MISTTVLTPPEFADVLDARARITSHTHVTPVLTSSYFDNLVGGSLFFKCENLQKVGAFKARGACNAVFGLDHDAARRGVITHSSGNHGQAIAYAAARRGIPSTIVMPYNAPDAKKDAVRGYGGSVVECEPTDRARQHEVDQLVARLGAQFIHPFNDARVIAGQATCALELFEQAGPLDAVIAPVGGGGLISGCCITAAEVAPNTRIIGAEPQQVDDAARSLKAGKLLENTTTNTVADGLKTNLQPLTWHFICRHVEDILVVSEVQIIETMRLIWQRMKILVEPSCAVPLAAMLDRPDQFRGQRTGVILTGGNVDLARLPWQRPE